MKDPYMVRRRRTNKIRLLVSFNGGFHRRQPSGKLRYTGGETRIVSVDRGVTFSRLKSLILGLVAQSGNVGCTFSLKYQLQDSPESERSDLFSVACDDDVSCMIHEFETREFQGKLTRLWVFVCTGSYSDNEFVDNDDKLHGKYGVLSNGRSCGDINVKTHLSKSDKGNKKLSDDSLRKWVLKQQLLAKQYSNKLRRDSESRSGENGVDLFKVNTLDYEYKNGDFGGNNENFEKVLPLPSSKSRPLNSKDNNLRLGVNCSMNGLSGSDHFVLDKSDCSGISLGAELQSLETSHSSDRSSRIDHVVDAELEAGSVDSTQSSIMNRENIVPSGMDFNMKRTGVAFLPRNNQLIASIYAPMQGNEEVLGGYHCRFRNHRVGLSESRNYPYQLRNRGNGYEMSRHRNFRLNGKFSTGKFFPNLRSGSSILKRGLALRSYNFFSSIDSSSHQRPTVKDVKEMNNLHPNNDSSALDELVNQNGQGLPQHGEENSTECYLHYGSGNIDKSDGSPLPNNSESDRRAMNSEKDLLGSPDAGKLEIQSQALSKDVVDRSATKPLSDINKDLRLLNQQEVNNIVSSEDNIKWSYDSMTLSSYQNSAHSFQHSVDLSLDDLYLSRSSKIELEGSLYAKNDTPQSFLKPQSRDFDAMDEEHFSTGPQVERSSGSVSCLLLDSDFRKKKYNNCEEDMQHNVQTNPSNCEQVENGKTNKCSNVNGVFPTDILACYPCAGKTGLQTIKNTDLEYIKELGSGTYGTVFYGKWKGSDVAIKKLKPSCFTEGAVEEDRLVTDYWKEAHIMGQLHHPNIVALYGVVTDGSVNNLATVTEFMVNGSLKQVLRRKDRTIDRRKRLIIAMDAAFGMEYLHEKNIVHFDLKSHNFLVNMRDPQRPVCKIGDLGLSKIKQRTLVSGGVRGTIPWMAPELLNGENMVTEKVDVYSFGIVMWELLTGEEPYSKMRAEEVIVGIISGNLRPETPSWCDPGWRSLMERCWSSNPKDRPAFSDIATELRAMAAAMNIK